MKLTIVGLGAGHPEDITRRAWKTLQNAPEIYLRTGRHPCVAALGRPVHTFDALYDQAEDFASLYERIVQEILTLARRPQGVVYAVPGHPLIGEQTVSLLLEKADGLEVEILHGLSFIEPCLTLLKLDGMSGLQIHDALDVAAFHHPPLNPDYPALLGQVYSGTVASDVKLTLMNQYPDEHPVTLIHAAGLTEAQIENLPLYALDRSPHLSHLSTLYVPPLPRPSSVERFQETIAHLRAPEGCPWDREQTHQSLRPHLLEETYEVLEALDADDPVALREELGDLLLQIVLHSQIAIDEGEFSLADVVADINAKIIRRHPHVWGEASVETVADLHQVWEAQKATENAHAEGSKKRASLLDGVPKGLPALAQAEAYQRKAAKVGFDWDSLPPVIAKVQEEIAELQAAQTPAEQSAELGDLLFALVNWGRWLKLDPETALRESSQRFKRRFQYIEQQAVQGGQRLAELSLEVLDGWWNEAKKQGL
jgi:tetrapyrrole methylase family protein/MazG family protein